MSRRKLGLVSAACVAVGVLLAACSSSGGSSAAQGAASSGSGSSGSGSSGSGSSASANSASYASLVPLVDQLEQRPTSIKITTPINGKIPAGKTIAFIQCGSPICVTMGNVLAQGGAALNWKIDRIDAGLTSESVGAAWTQAVNTRPDAVITSGTAKALFTSQLAQLAALKIPVLDMGTTDPTGDGITQLFANADENAQQGKYEADYMLANSGGAKVNELSVTITIYPVMGAVSNGVSTELKAQCSDCSANILAVPASSLGGDMTTRITSYLSAHPSVNWIFLPLDDMATGLPAALGAAGFGNVKVVTEGVNSTIAAYLENGQNVVMTAGFDYQELMWRCLDYLARTWTGTSTAQTISSSTLPVWFITKANIPAGNGSFPFVANYQQQYEALWHT